MAKRFSTLLSRDDFESIFQHSPVGCAITALDGKFIRINASFCDLLGYTPEEMEQQDFRNLTHPDDVGISEVFLKGLLSVDEPDSNRLEKRYLHKFGHTVWVLLATSIIRDDQGMAVHYISQIVDVSARVSVDRLIATSERKYRQLIESANDAIFVAEAETGIVVDANKKAEELIGIPRDQIIGIHQMELHPPEEAENYAKVFRDYLSNGIGVIPDLDAYHRSGRRIPVEISASAYQLDGKNYVQGIFRNVTERQVLVNRLRRSKRLTDALVEIDMALGSTMDNSEIMQKVTQASREALPCESTAVIFAEEDEWVLQYGSGWIEQRVGFRFPLSSFRCGIEAVEQDHPCIITEADDERIEHSLALELGINSALVVPIRVRGEKLGVLAYLNHSKNSQFDNEQIEFAGKLASSSSLALHESWLYRSQAKIANTLQESILTMPERLDGVSYAHIYRSATESARVGGDFYDLFELEHDQLGLIIGDISGKGLQAAALTSLVKNVIRAYAYEHESPGDVLEKANRVLVDSSPASMFATVFYGILDRSTGKLVYSSAGHPAPIISRKNDTHQLEQPSGMLLGAFPDSHFESDIETLHKGDVLFLYTDGFFEAKGADGLFGEERLIKAVKKASPLLAAHIPDKVFSIVQEFAGGSLGDDLAAIALSLDRRNEARPK